MHIQISVYMTISNHLICFQIRHKFDCHDTIEKVDGRDVRHCNWIRFLKSSNNLDDVNMVGVKVDGEAIFQTVKIIRPNEEVLAFFDITGEENTERETISMKTNENISHKESIITHSKYLCLDSSNCI